MFQRVGRIVGVGLVLAVFGVLIPSIAFAGGTVSLVGEVNDDAQFVMDNGRFYEIMTNDKGEELIGNAGKRVKVTGEVVEEGADRSIKVLSYEVLEQAEDEEQDDEKSDKE